MENQSNKITSRQRSPDYPFYNLKECISFIVKYREKNKFNKSYFDDAITAMGFSLKSSSGNRVIASLLNYGLFQDEGVKAKRLVEPTRLAQEILLEKDGTTHYFELLQQAAQHDNSTRMILELWGSEVPSEDTIKRHLFLEMKFSEEGAKRCASVFLATYEFANLKEIFNKPINFVTMKTNTENDNEENRPGQTESPKSSKSGVTTPSVKIRKANLLLSGDDREVVISVPSDLTGEEFNFTLKWLELQKFGLVRKDKIVEKGNGQVTEENPF